MDVYTKKRHFRDYSSDAVTYDKVKSDLRLIDGPGLVDLICQHYSNFAPAAQTITPLRQVYVPRSELSLE